MPNHQQLLDSILEGGREDKVEWEKNSGVSNGQGHLEVRRRKRSIDLDDTAISLFLWNTNCFGIWGVGFSALAQVCLTIAKREADIYEIIQLKIKS